MVFSEIHTGNSVGGRPMVMMFFLILLGTYWFGLAPQYLIDNLLLEIGIGVYIVVRSNNCIVKKHKTLTNKIIEGGLL